MLLVILKDHQRINGQFKASDSYGLGVELDFTKLGKPEFIIS